MNFEPYHLSRESSSFLKLKIAGKMVASFTKTGYILYFKYELVFSFQKGCTIQKRNIDNNASSLMALYMTGAW